MSTKIIKIFEDFDPHLGGTVLLLSREYQDGYKRVFLSRILQYKKEKGSGFPKITVKIDLKYMYLLNEIEYEGKTEIWGDKVPMNGDDLKNIMNMKSDWVVINDKKTPRGSFSIEFQPKDFLVKFQDSIKSLKTVYPIKFEDGEI